jgi:hypothetical protein
MGPGESTPFASRSSIIRASPLQSGTHPISKAKHCCGWGTYDPMVVADVSSGVAAEEPAQQAESWITCLNLWTTVD